MKGKYWESDAAAVELMRQVSAAEQAAQDAKKLARALREQAAARMRDIIPTPERLCEMCEAEDIYRHIAEGLYHWSRHDQPKRAWMSHHAAFGRYFADDWVHLEYSLHNPQQPSTALKEGHQFVRVGLSIRECYSPVEHSSAQLTQWPKDWDKRLSKWVHDACAAVRARTREYTPYGDWSGPLDTWGGGQWASLVVAGPVHPSYLKAQANQQCDPFGKKNWVDIVPPVGWEVR